MFVNDNPRVCEETPVNDRALQFLLSEKDPGGRFTTIDFYKIAFECVETNVKFRDCQSVLAAFIKATEVLEVLCVNLFLYPWKKEIKSLKTYTGAFVYCIQSVLPASATQSILASVGYQPQSDNKHYLLTDTANPEIIIGVGFDLFLARKECEHLLQVMGQGSQPECLEILQRRAMLTDRSGPEEETVAGTSQRETAQGLEQEEEEGLSAGCSLVVPGPEMIVEDQMSSRSAGGLTLEAAAVPAASILSLGGLGPSGAPLNEDGSILEMQRNYPDLAIRKKPIFNKPQRPHAARNTSQKQQPAGLRRAGCPAGQPLSGPQATSIHTPADKHPLQEPHAKNRQARPAAPEGSGSREQEGPEWQARDGAEVGTEGEDGALVQLHLHEENLRFPVEETAAHDPETNSDLGSSRDQAPPILLCHPSLVPVCSILGCNSCGEGGDNLMEPPHSVYIPANPLELCDRNQATECPRMDLLTQATEGLSIELQYQAEGPNMDLQSQAMEGPSMDLQSQAMGVQRAKQHISTTQQPEDELVHTYVMVEHDKK